MVGNSTAVTPHGTSSVPNPTTNIGLDANTALLYSDNAPLASASRGGDAKAVWACVPNRFVPSIPQLLVYFHGNDYFVTAELKNGAAVGRRPDWWTKSTSKVDPVAAVPPKGNKPGRAAIPNGQGACGHYYKFDAIDAVVSSTVTNLPLVLLPEDGMASGQTYPSGTATLEAMVDDCLTGLFKLAKPGGGSNYLTQQLHPKDMRRLFLTGHSGGGGPLYEACSSSLLKNIPTTFASFDATYISKLAQIQTFRDLGNIGMGPNDNRAVIIYTPGLTYTYTAAGQAKVAANAKKAAAGQDQDPLVESDYEHDDGSDLPNHRSGKWWTKKYSVECYNTLKAKFPSVACPNVLSHPTDAQVTAALTTYAIVCIETSVAHDNIPQTYYPQIVQASAPPSAAATTPSQTPVPPPSSH